MNNSRTSKYVYNAFRFDTTPGKRWQTFSPPQNWQGDESDYLNWLRQQFKNDHKVREKFYSLARSIELHESIKITGPHRKALRNAINAINAQLKKKHVQF